MQGGSFQQKTKFYTDLWHVLLGRHKIDDSNGEYPDYLSGGERIGKQTRIHKIAPSKYGLCLKIKQENQGFICIIQMLYR